MNKPSIKRQLALAFGLLALLVLTVSLLGIYDLTLSNRRFVDYLDGADQRKTVTVDLRNAVDARAIAARNIVLVDKADEREAEVAKVKRDHAAVVAAVGRLQSLAVDAVASNGRERALIDEVVRIEQVYGPVALGIVALAQHGKRDEAIRRMNVDCRPLLAALGKAADDYLAYTREIGRTETSTSQAEFVRDRFWLMLLAVAAFLTAAVLGLWIVRRLVAALGSEPADLRLAVERVAGGDLGAVPGADTAPAGSVLASIGTMQASLVALIGQVRGAADSIATASMQIAQGNQDLSRRTESQASALQETASSMEQLGSTVQQTADNADRADQLAKAASAVAAKGGAAVDEVVAMISGIDEGSRKIADIIGVIDGIAFQTNILALNAAVEAARAGEQGRGFAVVASEVRSLAQRSAQASREIRSLIGASVNQVGQGTALADQAGAKVKDVVESIRRVTDIMSEISAAAREQSAGVTQIGSAVGQIDQDTQQNAALVEESAAAAENLRQQAAQLVRSVARFTIPGRAPILAMH